MQDIKAIMSSGAATELKALAVHLKAEERAYCKARPRAVQAYYVTRDIRNYVESRILELTNGR